MILDQPNQPALNETQQKQRRQNELRLKAHALQNAPRQAFGELQRVLTDGIDAIWDDPDPQAVLNALGTNAGTLFALSKATTEFLLKVAEIGCSPEQLPAAQSAIVAIVAKSKPVTIHVGGSATLSDPIVTPG